MTHITFPPSYETIREWVLTQKFVTHSSLQKRWNLRYERSLLIIESLIADGVIAWESDAKGNYRVRFMSPPE